DLQSTSEDVHGPRIGLSISPHPIRLGSRERSSGRRSRTGKSRSNVQTARKELMLSPRAHRSVLSVEGTLRAPVSSELRRHLQSRLLPGERRILPTFSRVSSTCPSDR